ncbi:MAG: hypothetical protein M1838_001846 [Thelocarpon superellum]|nr:MAG: hypothetical protein M1838_001846 [Thelocarpon superellum]
MEVSQGSRSLVSLPSEILFQICRNLHPEDLGALSQVCSRLRDHAHDDSHWQRLIQDHVPGCRITRPFPAESFRQLFTRHYPRWFLPRYKIWFADEPHVGKLLVARYEPRTGTIEAYRLVAERGTHSFQMWEHDPQVSIHTFAPTVSVHVDNPVIRLEPRPLRPALRMHGRRILPAEIPVDTPQAAASGLFSNFMLARLYPTPVQRDDGSRSYAEIWPPATVPAPQHVSIPDREGPNGLPSCMAEVPDTIFRIRRWMEFVHSGLPVGVRMGEVIATYSTLLPALYTPTASKPWRGIWVGDYAGHGCEFLLLLQPDDPIIDVGDHLAQSADHIYQGELKAVKLTGDPNVPRGQVTFVAADLGPGGLLRIAEEAPFTGARVVRSKGHVAARGFRDDQYLDSELMMLSADRLAHYWKVVKVNTSTPVVIETPHSSTNLNVRIQNYRGLPEGSPSTSPYFSTPAHTADQYSIAFSVLPKSSIPGNDLVFGNDFDRPIRDRLPPGFNTAFRIVKWAIDPGIDGDPYADEPNLYGPALSSVNVFRVGEKQPTLVPAEVPSTLEEGGDGDGATMRADHNVPADAGARKKWFLEETKRTEWVFDAGRVYTADFFNPYLDFNRFALKLPGFSLSLMHYWDGQPLRYVLKNRKSGAVYFVIVFTLVPKADAQGEPAEKSGLKDTTEGKPEGHERESDNEEGVD